MRRMRYWVGSSLVTLILFVSGGRMSAQSVTNSFVPFNEFIARTAAAGFEPSTGKVADAASFEQMRHHIQDLYEGVGVTHSYVLGSQTFDCIPIDQQPSVRKLGLKVPAIPTPPALPANAITGQDHPAGQATAMASQLPASRYDTFGNALGCEAHTIPMRRLTLEEMTRFRNLREFLNKGPNGAGKPPVAPGTNSAPDSTVHKHATARRWVDNVGGNTNLNLWSPHVYTPWGEKFSLSQVWYSDGIGQTVEGGWQVSPHYGTDNSVLFIYWTADSYDKTGCYNLECSAFVQLDSTWHLGGEFANYSTDGGPQYEVQIEWWLDNYDGNWWLNVNGTWVGYYPGSLYGGGQLSRYATLFEAGGETDADPGVGYLYFPPMSSGNWANAGYSHAAYIGSMYYIDTANNIQWPLPSSFFMTSEAPACYSTWGPFYNFFPPDVWFYFGGPGGWC